MVPVHEALALPEASKLPGRAVNSTLPLPSGLTDSGLPFNVMRGLMLEAEAVRNNSALYLVPAATVFDSALAKAPILSNTMVLAPTFSACFCKASASSFRISVSFCDMVASAATTGVFSKFSSAKFFDFCDFSVTRLSSRASIARGPASGTNCLMYSAYSFSFGFSVLYATPFCLPPSMVMATLSSPLKLVISGPVLSVAFNSCCRTSRRYVITSLVLLRISSLCLSTARSRAWFWFFTTAA